jgi:hypothetical protein
LRGSAGKSCARGVSEFHQLTIAFLADHELAAADVSDSFWIVKSSAFGNVVPSIAMVCNGVEGVVEVELTSTIEAVVLLADAVA